MTELVLKALIDALKIDGKEVTRIELSLSRLPSQETHLS